MFITLAYPRDIWYLIRVWKLDRNLLITQHVSRYSPHWHVAALQLVGLSPNIFTHIDLIWNILYFSIILFLSSRNLSSLNFIYFWTWIIAKHGEIPWLIAINYTPLDIKAWQILFPVRPSILSPADHGCIILTEISEQYS